MLAKVLHLHDRCNFNYSIHLIKQLNLKKYIDNDSLGLRCNALIRHCHNTQVKEALLNKVSDGLTIEEKHALPLNGYIFHTELNRSFIFSLCSR